MKNADDIKKIFDNAVIQTNANQDEIIIEKMTAAFNQTHKAQSEKTGPKIWRIIMRSPITKLAAAIVIIAFVLSISILDKTGAPAYALEQTLEKMKNEPWVHFIMNMKQPGLRSGQSWLSFAYCISAEYYENNEVEFTEFKKKESYIYEPNSNTITISFAEKNELYKANSIYEYVDLTIKILRENEGAKVTKRISTINDQNFEVFEISVPRGEPLGSLGTEIWRLTINKETQLLTRMELEGYDKDKKFMKVADVSVEYPDTGPIDIYQMGVPKTAKILDKRPSVEVKAIIDKYEAARKNDLSHYTAFELYTVTNGKGNDVAEEVDIWYTDSNLQRWENLSPTWDIINKQRNGTLEVISDMGNTIDSMISWWTDPCHITLRRARLAVGKELYLFSYDLKTSKILQDSKDDSAFETKTHIEKFYVGTGDFFVLGPREPTITIVENEYARENGLICLQKFNDEDSFSTPFGRRYKRLCFLDPQKDYICTRIEEYLIQDAQWQKEYQMSQNYLIKNPDKTLEFTQRTIREVKEFGKTNSGNWYPKKIETQTTTQGKNGKTGNSISTHTIYLDEAREIPKGIFDVNSFKKYLVK